ncbi:MAG: glycoside hydrolase family 3 protein [Lachnospiraceae bacterium]|jgi:beta-N-acetylhexosaminidase|nr:glycoside hydrolase family 3 protein [Lachnospiraceae bacterium]
MSKKIIVGVLLTAALIIGAGKVMDVKKPLLEAKQEEVAPEVETETEPEEVKEIKTEEVKEPEKSAEELLEEQIDKMIADMSLEERVLQLFVITPEALTRVDTVVVAGEATKEAIIERPVGGLIYFQKNLQNPEQVKEMLSNTYQYYREAGAPVPFLSVDEEGGSVARIGGQSAFGVERLPDMRVIGENGNAEEAKRVGDVIGSYLSELGFNLDFAPDVDVLTNPQNEVVKKRSFGSDAELVSRMSMAVVKGLEEHGIYATLKHYPGHGATLSDSHKGYAYTDKTLEELMEEELIPFKEGISEDIHFIMVAHISVPEITKDTVPCSLSPYMVTDVLREQLGYQGIVITDAMNMGAISQEYNSKEASVMALKAGVDLVLMPTDFEEAYQGVLSAIEEGELTEERIDESVRRVLRLKNDKNF